MKDNNVVVVWRAHLTPFGVAVRYPDEIAPDEIIAQKAVENAQLVYDFCVAKAGSYAPK